MAFVTLVIVSRLVLIGVLIERVICQVHINIVHVLASWSFVRISAEPGEGHLVQVDPQRTHTIQKHIDSQIVLQVINEVRPVNILLNDVALLRCRQTVLIGHGSGTGFLLVDDLLNLIDRSCEENSFALALRVRFDDVGNFVLLTVVLIMCEIVPQVGHLTWQHPRLGEEIILRRHCFVHIHQVPCQVVFLRDTADARVHIYLLVGQQFRQETGCDSHVMPRQVIHR